MTTRVLIVSGLVALFVAATFATVLITTSERSELSREARLAEQTLEQTQKVEKLTLDLETGARGYLLTGQRRFLQPWSRARPVYRRELSRLVTVAGRDAAPRSEQLARRIERGGTEFLDAWSDPLVASIATRPRRALRMAKTGQGKRRVDALRALFSGVANSVRAEARGRTDRTSAADRRLVAAGAIGAGGSILLVLGFGFYVVRGLARPVRRMSHAADRMAAGDLATRVSVGGPLEVRELADSFNSMSSALEAREAEQEAARKAITAAKDEADQANQAKSKFLSRMSHELRTPLNAVLGFGQLLQMDDLDTRQRENVDYIIKAGRHLLDLINEVLDLSRIEAGEMTLSPEPVHAAGVLEEVLALTQPMAAEHQIALHADPGALSERYAHADQQRLKQVLLNLASNAIKYNRAGGTVTMTLKEGPPGRLRILVADSGYGIPPERLDSVFSAFDRLGAEQSEVEGTGLGLALTKQLVEVMGGTIEVESEVGRGTTFSLELPTAERPEEEPPAEIAPIDLVESAKAPTRTILYIEDNLANLTLIEKVLGGHDNLELLPAMQGGLGLELARQHRPDLIMLDLHLPDMPGKHVLAHLKGDSRTREIPVVILSADVTRGQAQRLLDAGAAEYLTKPLDVTRFLGVVDRNLHEREAATSA